MQAWLMDFLKMVGYWIAQGWCLRQYRTLNKALITSKAVFLHVIYFFSFQPGAICVNISHTHAPRVVLRCNKHKECHLHRHVLVDRVVQ